jgi:hypothetical protein
LVKKIDAETLKNSNKRMGSFVVFLNERDGLATDLKALAEKEAVKETVLTTDGVAGPDGYKIAREADVTVVLYNRRIVEANYTFRIGKLTDEAIDKIISDVNKMVN